MTAHLGTELPLAMGDYLRCKMSGFALHVIILSQQATECGTRAVVRSTKSCALKPLRSKIIRESFFVAVTRRMKAKADSKFSR
jgi:hypothetical protein